MRKLIFFISIMFTGAFLSAQIRVVPAGEFGKIIREPGVQIVDVRTPGEFGLGHISGAVNMPVDTRSFDQKMAELDKSAPVALYCGSGGRSGRAAKIFEKNGFTGYDLAGGLAAWEKEGKPLEK